MSFTYTIRVVTGEKSDADDTRVFISLYGKKGCVIEALLDKNNSVKNQEHLFHAGQVNAHLYLSPPLVRS